MSERSSILLVHGAWHGSWCWDAVRERLAARGWDVVAIDLPTAHARNKAELGMYDDARAVSDAVAAIEGPVTVVAHSYGGVPTTQGATDPKVRHIVYVTSFVLDEGESLLGAIGGVAPDWWHIDGPLVTAGDDAQPPRALFFGDVDPAQAAEAAARLLPHAAQAFSDPLTAVAWRDRPTTYVVGERDAVLPAAVQEAFAARSDSATARLGTSHSPFLSQPDRLAEIIEHAAG